MSKAVRKLHRIREQKVVAGVCSGLGEHFNLDPVIFRVLFILLTLASTLGIIAYGILWIIVPTKSKIVANNN